MVNVVPYRIILIQFLIQISRILSAKLIHPIGMTGKMGIKKGRENSGTRGWRKGNDLGKRIIWNKFRRMNMKMCRRMGSIGSRANRRARGTTSRLRGNNRSWSALPVSTWDWTALLLYLARLEFFTLGYACIWMMTFHCLGRWTALRGTASLYTLILGRWTRLDCRILPVRAAHMSWNALTPTTLNRATRVSGRTSLRRATCPGSLTLRWNTLVFRAAPVQISHVPGDTALEMASTARNRIFGHPWRYSLSLKGFKKLKGESKAFLCLFVASIERCGSE